MKITKLFWFGMLRLILILEVEATLVNTQKCYTIPQLEVFIVVCVLFYTVFISNIP